MSILVRYCLVTTVFLSGVVAGSRAQSPVNELSHDSYGVPYLSQANRVEMEIVNSTRETLKGVSIQLIDSPRWVAATERLIAVGSLRPGEIRTAVFVFGVQDDVPVGEAAELTFHVRSAKGLLKAKEIRISVVPPTTLRLLGNYPNPLRTRTVIRYAVPRDGEVEIDIMDALGHRISRIVDEVQSAGNQEVVWNAMNVPSGLYFYRIRFADESGGKTHLGKMIVIN